MARGIGMTVLLILGHPSLADAAPDMGSSIDACAKGAPECNSPGESDSVDLLQTRQQVKARDSLGDSLGEDEDNANSSDEKGEDKNDDSSDEQEVDEAKDLDGDGVDNDKDVFFNDKQLTESLVEEGTNMTAQLPWIYNGEYKAYWAGTQKFACTLTATKFSCAPHTSPSAVWNNQFTMWNIKARVSKSIAGTMIVWDNGQLWYASTAAPGTFTVYRRATEMPGHTVCLASGNKYTCVNTGDGGRQEGTLTAQGGGHVLNMYGVKAYATTDYGSLVWSNAVIWIKLVPGSTLQVNGKFCTNRGSYGGHGEFSTVTEKYNPAACTAWVAANPGCGQDYDYDYFNGYCDCVKAGDGACIPQAWPYYGTYKFDTHVREMMERVVSKGGRWGKACTISLIWSNRQDLDLYLYVPGDDEPVKHNNKKSEDEMAQLDIDVQSDDKPVENIFLDAMKQNKWYTVKVQMYSGHEPTPFNAMFVCKNKVQWVHAGATQATAAMVTADVPVEFSGTVAKEKEVQTAFTFYWR